MERAQHDADWLRLMERETEDRSVIARAIRWLQGRTPRGERDPVLPWDSPKFGRMRLSR